ncbi:MAG: D-cysteine desulfhydrase family protein, partial [Armatimonadota bacterium]
MPAASKSAAPSPPRVALIQRPTPLHRLDRLSDQLGIDLWIKRDDLTGFAMGGNKGRKLEYLLGEALAQGATAVVTCGSAQSNFLRHLSIGCAMLKLRCAAVVMPLPYEDEPASGGLLPEGGNLLLDRLAGCELTMLPNGNWDSLMQAGESLALQLEAEGERVYRIPIGGSSVLGARAFVEAASEVGTDWQHIVTASSSGSTQTGLVWSFAGTRTKVIGVACDPEPELVEEFVLLAAGLDSALRTIKGLRREHFNYDLRFVGPGY